MCLILSIFYYFGIWQKKSRRKMVDKLLNQLVRKPVVSRNPGFKYCKMMAPYSLFSIIYQLAGMTLIADRYCLKCRYCST